MKWLKKLILLWRLRELKQECLKASPFKANRALCHKLLTALPDNAFETYRPSDSLGLSLTIQYPDIETMVQKIKESCRMVREQKPIPTDWSNKTETSVALDRFISTQAGYYSNPATTVRRYKKQALELCELMAVSDTETVGLPEHNLRMLTKLFIDIRMVTSQLLELSHQ